MVKASELRIGNIILLATFPVFPVNWINSKWVSIGEIVPEHFPEHEWGNKFAPIRLTDEVLDMCNVNQIAMNEFMYLPTGIYFSCAYDLKYLHQLQNLYYATFSKELEIKNLVECS